MATIGQTDIRGFLNQGIGQRAFALPGRGMSQFGEALQDSGTALGKFGIDMQLRDNELKVTNASGLLRDFRREVLLGDGGALRVNDMGVVGVTERTGTFMTDKLAEIESGLDNQTQRDAFRTAGGKLIATTLDTVAAHEADSKEKLRVAQATANHEDEMSILMSTHPTAFIASPGQGQGMLAKPDIRGHILEQIEDYILATNPELNGDDATITKLAQMEMANRAHEAVIGHLSRGEGAAIADGKKFLDQYGKRWSVEQRIQVEAAVDHQIGIQIMQDVVAGTLRWAQEEGEIDDVHAQVERARKWVKQTYQDPELGTGRPVPPDLIDEVSRRMVAENSLVEKSTKAKVQRENAEIVGTFFQQALRDPTNIEGHLTTAINRLPPDRPSVGATLFALYNNIERSGGPFAAQTDNTGWTAYAMSREQDLRLMPVEEMYANAAHMAPKQGEKYIAKWQTATNNPTGDDEHSRVMHAINAARGSLGKEPFESDDADMGLYVFEMTRMLETREGPTTPTEMQDLARELFRTLDTDSFKVWQNTNTQTWAKFINDPEPLNLSDPLDKHAAASALFILKRDEDLLRKFIYTHPNAAGEGDTALMRALAQDHNLVSNLLRHGLTNRSIFNDMQKQNEIGEAQSRLRDAQNAAKAKRSVGEDLDALDDLQSFTDRGN